MCVHTNNQQFLVRCSVTIVLPCRVHTIRLISIKLHTSTPKKKNPFAHPEPIYSSHSIPSPPTSPTFIVRFVMYKIPRNLRDFKVNWLFPKILNILVTRHNVSPNIARIYTTALCGEPKFAEHHSCADILKIISSFSREDIKKIRQVYEQTKIADGDPFLLNLVSNVMEPQQQKNLNAKRIKKSDNASNNSSNNGPPTGEYAVTSGPQNSRPVVSNLPHPNAPVVPPPPPRPLQPKSFTSTYPSTHLPQSFPST